MTTPDPKPPETCPLTEEQIAQWKAICDAATEAPWEVATRCEDYISGLDYLVKFPNGDDASVLSPEDAAFIALARTALPVALDALTAALAKIALLERQLALSPVVDTEWTESHRLLKDTPGDTLPQKVERLLEGKVVPAGEWRVWSSQDAGEGDGFLQVATNSQRTLSRLMGYEEKAGEWAEIRPYTSDELGGLGYLEVTDTTERAAIVATLLKEVRG